MVLLATTTGALAATADNVSQYGITWKFDKAYPVGQFITGDWWVVGPVTVVSVTPAPGPAPADESVTAQKSRYGATALRDDKQMRNGSMIITGSDPVETAKHQTGFGNQGYDSRGVNYSPELSVKFPLQLPVNRTLISTVSCETYGPDGKLKSPSAISGLSAPGGPPLLLFNFSGAPIAMTDAAVLTCLDKAPPADAFRPPYVGTEKPIYESKDIQWDLLPNLKAPDSTPDWAKMERIYQRPWLDHVDTWAYSYCFPTANQPGYGREVARINSMAGLMLLLDVPREKKEKLLIEYIQNGIDIRGVGAIGRNWIFEDGGHWIGRKWPVLFASIMLNNASLRDFPPADPSRTVFNYSRITPATPAPNGLFCEDTDTYYGKGGDGQTALGQVLFHGQQRFPFEETPRSQFNGEQRFLDEYRTQAAISWSGEALAALLMKGKAIWNHDAFFDYADRIMGPNPCTDFGTHLLPNSPHQLDLFVTDMWNAYRKTAPDQPGGKDNLKWVWNTGKYPDNLNGHFEDNPKPVN